MAFAGADENVTTCAAILSNVWDSFDSADDLDVMLLQCKVCLPSLQPHARHLKLIPTADQAVVSLGRAYGCHSSALTAPLPRWNPKRRVRTSEGEGTSVFSSYGHIAPTTSWAECRLTLVVRHCSSAATWMSPYRRCSPSEWLAFPCKYQLCASGAVRSRGIVWKEQPGWACRGRYGSPRGRFSVLRGLPFSGACLLCSFTSCSFHFVSFVRYASVLWPVVYVGRSDAFFGAISDLLRTAIAPILLLRDPTSYLHALYTILLVHKLSLRKIFLASREPHLRCCVGAAAGPIRLSSCAMSCK